MRLIDAEPIERQFFKEADKSLAKNPYEKARICAFRRAFEMVSSAPTVEPLPNTPLTLDDLREMDGEPVWVERPGYGKKWALVRVWAKSTNVIYFTYNVGSSSMVPFELDNGARVYRRKPDDER